ncbi:hypothetical protein SAMN05216429_105155 [Marinobacter persicus]|uniref:Uncharacterized protein n=1 Tax=Marinobacter persicus TaxID=930118 RepID=A0A1I3TTJ6_9GAMM|nr:hypothetical protein [Marinobacter persicus]GHD45808.1 hypothetical protein GCM10008110_12090 [Marinobacter persicus]SFJ74095.1 hypothetical protein SAMN05216429_105155 [Marinobacter persicus]
MFDTETTLAYGIFWIAYCVGFVLFFYMMKALFRFLPFYGLRTLLLSVLVVLLLTPVESPEVAGWWIPAWLFSGYELVLGDTRAAADGLFNFAVASVVMLLVWLLDLVRYRLTRK